MSAGIEIESGAAYEPLTEDEIKTINRLLGDPTVFPRSFKRFITDHASDSVDIAKSQVHGLINARGAIIFSDASWEQLSVALVGLMLPFPSSVPPKGWFACEGQDLLITEYDNLYGMIGHNFGSPYQFCPAVPAGYFRLPDMRGRTPFGVDWTPDVGRVGFAENDWLAPGKRGSKHHHTVMPHSHGFQHIHYTSLSAEGTTTVQFQAGGMNVVTAGQRYWGTEGANPAVTSDAPQVGTSGDGALDTPGFMGIPWIIAGGKIPK